MNTLAEAPVNYKERVSYHLRDLAARGLTQKKVAEQLGVPSVNFVSMVGNAKVSALLPVTRLPALQRLCGFDDSEGLRLFCARVSSEPDRPLQMDRPTLVWLVRCALRTFSARSTRKAPHAAVNA